MESPVNTNKEKSLLIWLTIIEFVVLIIAFFANTQLVRPEANTSHVLFYFGAYVSWFLILAEPLFFLLLVVQALIIFKNLFSKNLTKSSFIALLITLSQPMIIVNVYQKAIYYSQIFTQSAQELFYRPADHTTYYSLVHPNVSVSLNLLLLAIETVLIILFLFSIKKESVSISGSKRKILSWIGSIAVLALLFGGYSSIEAASQNRLTTSNIQFRLNYSGDNSAVPLSGFEISSLAYDKTNSSNIRMEFSSIPSQVTIGTSVIVFAALPAYLGQNDHLRSSCVIQKDPSTNTSWCSLYFSSSGPNFLDKTIYSFYVADPVGTNQ